MKHSGQEISRHIHSYYQSLYRGERRCRAPIPQGLRLARALEYPGALKSLVAEELWPNFVPCGNPLPMLKPVAGGAGLNIGCGAGIDALALGTLDASLSPIVNLDPVTSILKTAAALMPGGAPETRRIRWCAGTGETLPFKYGTFHWVLMNGVFNLFPAKQPVLREIYRVLKNGGQLVICDLFLEGPLPDYFKEELDAWVWCLNGSVERGLIKGVLETAGFCMERFEPQESVDSFCRAGLSARKKGSTAV